MSDRDSVLAEINELLEHYLVDYREIKAGVRKLLDGAREIQFTTGDPVELAAMLEIQRHADAILELVAKMEKRKEGGY